MLVSSDTSERPWCSLLCVFVHWSSALEVASEPGYRRVPAAPERAPATDSLLSGYLEYASAATPCSPDGPNHAFAVDPRFTDLPVKSPGQQQPRTPPASRAFDDSLFQQRLNPRLKAVGNRLLAMDEIDQQ